MDAWFSGFLKSLILLFLGLLSFMNMSFSSNPNLILIADRAVQNIPIHENQEPLLDVRQHSNLCLGPSPEIPDNDNYYYLRKTVLEKLILADRQLPKGLHICIYEGYRSIQLQTHLFDTHYRNIKAQHPDWSLDKLFNETTKLVSPVVNADGSANIPPHATGAAVDVYLIDEKGHAVDMGIHPKDWMRDKDGRLSKTDSADVSALAKQHRAILNRVMQAAGFINYPTEYWHWSYGDKYWAYLSGKKTAIYGLTDKSPRNLPR